MDSKKVKFYIYRYHLLPISTESSQLTIFPDKNTSVDEIKSRKNEFLANVLEQMVNLPSNTNPMKMHHHEGDFYLFKMANKKIATLTKDFVVQKVENEPFVYVVINNNPKVQKIAISENIDAFSSTTVTKNVLLKILTRELAKYSLNMQVEQIFDSVNFWELVGKHKDRITYLNFKFIKPNLANISKSLPEAFRKFTESTNGHESHVILKAPEKGSLENIDKNNPDVKGMVDYAAEGGGNIKAKLKGIRKQFNTDEKAVTLTIDDIEMEGPASQLFKFYKDLVE